MLTGYIVEMSSWPITTDSEPPEPTDWTIVTSKCHSTSYIMRNLAEDREYIFRVRAQNIHGPSAPGKVCEPVSFSKADTDFDDVEERIEQDIVCCYACQGCDLASIHTQRPPLAGLLSHKGRVVANGV